MAKKKNNDHLLKIGAELLTAKAIAKRAVVKEPAAPAVDPNAERPIRFVAEVGERGPQGEKGEKGDRGEKGEKGDRGLQGIPGVPGSDGKPGKAGSDGKPGKPGTKGDKGDTGDKGPNGEGFTWKGRWHSTQTYVKGDVVEFGGSSLVALRKTKERPDARATAWEMMAQHGASGLTGAAGPAGAAGATGAQGPAGADGSGSGSGIRGIDVYQDGVLIQALAYGLEFVGDDFALSVNSDTSINISSKGGSGSADTAAQILAKLVTVDGAGSGLDADLLDGQSSAAFAAASHTHAQSDITGLSTSLALKLDASAASAYGLTLIDDLDAATARSTLGLGTLATQNGPIGIDVSVDGVLVQALTPGLEFAGVDFALSVNSDGSVNITNKRPKKAFSGALVKKAADQTAANYSAGAQVAFDAEEYDEGGWHDNVTNNTRHTVPDGVTKVRLTANISVGSTTAATWGRLAFKKNGSESFAGNASNIIDMGATSRFICIQSAVLVVVPGDYFELFYQEESDTSITVNADRTTFAIEAVE